MTQFVLGPEVDSRHANRPTRDLQKHFSKGFDYESLSENREAIQAHAKAISTLRGRMAADAVEIGRRLLEVRASLGKRLWGTWLAAEFKWTQPVASRLMSIARKFGDVEAETLGNFDVSALYRLATVDTPPAAVEEAMSMAAAGAKVSQAVAYTILERHEIERPQDAISTPRAGRQRGDMKVPIADGHAAPKSAKQAVELSSITCHFRAAIGRWEPERRQEAAERALAAIRGVLIEFGLEHLIDGSQAARSTSRDRAMAPAARRIREAGIPALS